MATRSGAFCGEQALCAGHPPGMGAHQAEYRLLQKEGRTSNKWGTFRPSDGDEEYERNQAGGSRAARGQVRGCPLDTA